ncbi:MAG: macro domain-containing protein, partial [Clostridia bacterium]|nr:macro domain-containing protein [Clostridia bacterium]
GGAHGEEALLRSCYRRSLALALEAGCESVAFPLISAGAYGYPKRAAFDVAESEIRAFLRENELTVYLVLFRRGEVPFPVDGELAESLAEFEKPEPPLLRRVFDKKPGRASGTAAMRESFCGAAAEEVYDLAPASLSHDLESLDESFSQSLLRRIDEKGMTDVECYKRANVDRKLFSKIRGDALYRPSKQTAVAFAIALRLTRAETDDLLLKAGFALSRSNKFDVIISYFISRGIYDIHRVNEALFAYDQPLLGC